MKKEIYVVINGDQCQTHADGNVTVQDLQIAIETIEDLKEQLKKYKGGKHNE